MSDCISRHAAITEICCRGVEAEKEGIMYMTMVDAKQFFVDAIESLPAVDPSTDSTTTDGGSTTDCISREAAIQAVTHFDDPIKRLYELPSVEPERTADLTDNGIPIEEYTDCVRRKDVLWITKETGALETQARVVKLPSVEPERKTGKWIGEQQWCLPKCSICGASCFGLHGFDAIKTPYCPTCGAKMEVDG